MIKPKKLKRGDKVATISLSWGGAGELPYRYEAGKKQLQETFDVEVVETKHACKLKARLPHIKLVQVIHVIDEASIEEAIEISNQVDAILLDSGNPNLKIKELGGTGRVHNWELSKKIREAINIPLFLAGGLNASNVRKAIETVQPFGLDLCSGVRTNGHLDKNKLAAFFKAIRNI